MNPTRTRLLVVLVAVPSLLIVAAAGGAVPGVLSDGSSATENGEPAAADRPADPTTEDTVGYVEGYWYDDELPVDEREDGVVEDDELEAVVYRSMARVEVIRGLTFEDDVPVEVVSREEYRENDDTFLDDAGDEERLQLNVNTEALFAVDRNTDATDEQEALYGGAVDGYYEPSTDQVVIVSENPETPELNEVVLGHELLHALQDQHFDLASYERETIDQDNAKNGLVEGDAVRVETEYEDRCAAEWDCTLPDGGATAPPDLNWVMYTTIFQPYNDGPDYVGHLLEQSQAQSASSDSTGEGSEPGERDDWDAVDAAYDDPPASSSEVIRPGEDREPADIEVEDRSNDEWRQLEIDGEVASETYGEAGMVAMFAGDAHDRTQPSVIGQDDFFAEDLQGYDYDQPYTDGWAGDELVTYVTDEATETDDPAAAAAHAGYVWETEWTSSEDGQQFVDGYLQLLDLHDAEAVDGYQDTYVIDDEYPGAYHVDRDGESVTIVRAPSVDELPNVDSGAAPEGEDTLEIEDADPETTDDDGGDAPGDGSNAIPGFGVPVAVAAVAIALLAGRVRSAGRERP
ncbi:Hvo_1808 family surface protein [Natronococcus wangiae]|uniref:Hvo_1808 family surface protein n=1 Tax=Natronococcus wangiae TaxID=3068275 RepID=UPI00273D79C6|nr:Hvo_1808 family surface protein [Natronococcus sp. AD5]